MKVLREKRYHFRKLPPAHHIAGDQYDLPAVFFPEFPNFHR
jgi:hypothetical protein